jgi:predicted kinase
MQAIIFTGIQGSGKSSFYKARFFKTHIRLSLDMLHTRHRETLLIQSCIEAKQPFVVDNTNPTTIERVRYIQVAKAGRFEVIGYYFQSSVGDALRRNTERMGKERVPDLAILATFKKLQIPTLDEGFDALYYVQIDASGEFIIQEWHSDGL